MKYDQDLCLNFDLQKLLWQDELDPRVRCAFGNVSVYLQNSDQETKSGEISAIASPVIFSKFCHPRRRLWAFIENMITPDHVFF